MLGCHWECGGSLQGKWRERRGKGEWAHPSFSSWAPGKDCNLLSEAQIPCSPQRQKWKWSFPKPAFFLLPQKIQPALTPSFQRLSFPPQPIPTGASAQTPSPEAVCLPSSGQNLFLAIWRSNKGAVPAGAGVWPGGPDLCLTA